MADSRELLLAPADGGLASLGHASAFWPSAAALAVCRELAERGIKPINGPVDRSWGPRAAYFADPGGYVYEFAARKRD
jgi:catechol 2,3-dioxygenase-like lactoylglutathione lyase family enzyme